MSAEFRPITGRAAPLQARLFVDFDGTIALEDTTDVILERFVLPEWRVVEADWVAGRIGSRECLVDEVKPRLSAIETPALVIQAREDDLSSLTNAEYLQRHLGGLVDTLILDDSYHIVTVDRQRDILIESSVAFATVLAARREGADTVRSLEAAARVGRGQRPPSSAAGPLA